MSAAKREKIPQKITLAAEGITLTGRAIVERLRINRVELVNLRRFLIENGHPSE